MKRAPLLWQVMVFASLLILAGLLAWLYIRPSTVSERKDFIEDLFKPGQLSVGHVP